MFHINFKSIGKSFVAEDNETILDAALKNKLALPFGCLSGNCGSCKGRILEGEVNHGDAKPFLLSGPEKEKGYALFCQAKPTSDLIIDTITFPGQAQPPRKLPARITRVDKVTEDVVILELATPSSHAFTFTPGQYIDILLKDGKRRSYSMANLPVEKGVVELHVRKMNQGTFTEYAFGKMKAKDILRFEGPLGNFQFDTESDKAALFVASGTGFAPIKSIIEKLFFEEVERELKLYWGGRRPQDIYLSHLAEKWANERENFEFIPVVSEAIPKDEWRGRTGYVHSAVMEDYHSLENHQVYACGAPEMVEAAQRDFTRDRGLPEEEFFSDVFSPGK